MNISKKRISHIWALCRQAGMDRDLLYDLVHQVSGQDSLRALTERQGWEIISIIKKNLPEIPTGNPARINQGQIKYIYKMMYLLGWQKKQVDGFSRRMTGKAKIEWLTWQEARKVIEGLKKYQNRQGAHEKP